jgi:hypothetical protein
MRPLKTATLSTKVPIRVIALNAIQLVGILAASLVIPSPETAAVLAMLPDPLAGNIGKIALGLVAAKPAFNTVADLIDNGKLDGSYKSGLGLGRVGLYMLALLCAGFMLTGCGLKLNAPDDAGCFLITRTEKGVVYAAGPCAGGEGEIYAYRTEWTNADGVKLRATYIVATKETRIQYRTPDGVWVGWSSKAGITLDGLPPGTQPSLAG